MLTLVRGKKYKRELEYGTMTMYGDFKCSCGCQNPLEGLTHIVGDVSDDEGYYWRSFRPECWDKITNKYGKDLDTIYDNFESAEVYEI